jgi:hypothetical protein
MVYLTLPAIPFETADSPATFGAFLTALVSEMEVLSRFSDHRDIIPSFLRNWKRDFSILRSRRLLRESAAFVSADLPDDAEIADLMAATVSSSPPALTILPTTTFCSTDHSLVERLLDFIPRAADRASVFELSLAISAFVSVLKIDPTTIAIPNDDLYYEY